MNWHKPGRITHVSWEMAEQESRWKESYDLLLAENEKLKSSVAKALLAAQWRQWYEAYLKDKDDVITNWNMEKEKVMELQDLRTRADAGKYESKYRDFKVREFLVVFLLSVYLRMMAS